MKAMLALTRPLTLAFFAPLLPAQAPEQDNAAGRKATEALAKSWQES